MTREHPTKSCPDCGVAIQQRATKCRACWTRFNHAKRREAKPKPNPSGLCMCGCGQPTPLAKTNNARLGIVRGFPVRLIHGHEQRLRAATGPGPNPSGLCQCGCGGITPLARMTSKKLGRVKGCHIRFINGHQSRVLIKPIGDGLCECGCGNPTRIDYRGKPHRYIKGHEQRKPPVTNTCVICGAPFQVKPSMARLRTCGKVECKRQIRAIALANIRRERRSHSGRLNRISMVCDCGCGTVFERIPSRIRGAVRHFLNAEHARQYAMKTRVFRGPNTSGVTRYGSEWRTICKRIRERDKVCRMCGKSADENRRALDVHHIKPFRVSADNSDDNLIALCRSCHGTFTGKERDILPPLPCPKPRRPLLLKECAVCESVFETNRPRQFLCGSAECKRTHIARKAQKYWEYQRIHNTPIHQRKVDRERSSVRHLGPPTRERAA